MLFKELLVLLNLKKNPKTKNSVHGLALFQSGLWRNEFVVVDSWC